jgi:hypothetical protein
MCPRRVEIPTCQTARSLTLLLGDAFRPARDVRYHAAMTNAFRSVYATIIDISPLLPSEAFEPLLLVRQAWHDWAGRVLARKADFLRESGKPHVMHFDLDTIGQQNPIDGISIVQDLWEAKNTQPALSFASFQLREFQGDGRFWITNITMAARGAEATLAVQMGIESTLFRVQPSGWMVRAPGFWTFLTSKVACSVATGRITHGEVFAYTATDVALLVTRLCDHKRTLPIVVVSVDNRTGTTPVDRALPQVLSRELFGLAHVHYLTDADAAWELSRSINKEHGCYNGAIRIYWPDFDPKQPPDFRTLLIPEHIVDSSGLTPSRALSRVAAAVLRKIAPVSAVRFATPPLFAQISESRREEQRTTDLAKLRSELSDEAFQFIEQELKAKDEAHSKEVGALKQSLADAHAYYSQLLSSKDEAGDDDGSGYGDIIVEYFRSKNERYPVLEFAHSEFAKNPKMYDRYIGALTHFASRWKDNGGDLFKKLQGAEIVTRDGQHEDVWEYRAINSQGQWVRVLFALVDGRRAVLLHAVSKRQNELDRTEIDTAKRRLREYLE